MLKNIKQQVLIACLIILMMMLGVFWATNAFAADVTLQWDANTDPDLAGYYVYQAQRTGDKTTAWARITPNLVAGTTFVVAGLDDANYAWLVIAVDIDGNPSFVSNMVERYDRTPPGAVQNLRKGGQP